MAYIIYMTTPFGDQSATQITWDNLVPCSQPKASKFTTLEEAQAHALVLGRRLKANIKIGDKWVCPGEFNHNGLSIQIKKHPLYPLNYSNVSLYLDSILKLAPELSYIDFNKSNWSLSPNLKWEVDQELKNLKLN